MSEKTPSMTSVTARYAASRIFRQVCGLLTAFLRPKLLTPEHFGLWNLIRIVPGYSTYIHLGSRTSMRYRIPACASRGETDEIRNMQDTVFTSSLVLHGLVALGLLAFSFLPGLSMEERAGLWMLTAFVPLQFLFEYYVTILRAEENFSLVSATYYIESVTLLVMTVPLLYFFRIYGLYVSFLASFVFATGYFYYRRGLDVRLRFSWPLFRSLVAEGFPVLTIEIGVFLLKTSDRLVVELALDREQLGFYGIAILLASFLINAPGAAREVLEPRLMREIKDSTPARLTRVFLSSPMLSTAWLMPFVLGGAWLALPEVIAFLLPRYTGGVDAARVLIFGTLFLAMSLAPRTVVVAHRLQLWTLPWLPPILAVNVAVSLGLLRLGWGLPGVALGSSVAFLMLFLVSLGLACRALGPGRGPLPWWGLALPLPLMLALLAGLERLGELAALPGWLVMPLKVCTFEGLWLLLFLGAARRWSDIGGLPLGRIARKLGLERRC